MELVKFEQREMLGFITINREKALNALNTEVLNQLDRVLDEINLEEIRCIILTGAGEKAFVAGADIKEMSSLSQVEGEAFGKRGNEIFRKLEQFAVPVICAVNGYALGGGCELALSCDFRICSENAMFGQPEVGLGIIPGFGGTQRLSKAVGVGMAKQMIYTGKSINANEALRIGLVNEVHPVESLMDAAIKIAERIMRNAPIAIASCKKAINLGDDLPIEKGLELEAKLFGACFTTEDQKEGMAAFLEKRRVERFLNR
jgi:enoyl-CoA hydratase